MKMIGRTVFLLFVTMAFLTACSTPTVSSDDSDEVSSSSKKENQPESSSSSVDKKESSSEVKRTSWDYLNPDIDYGELVDKRDGQIYKTVKIGVQMWMAENLNYASSEGSFCYGNSADSCAKYGRLYTWAAAMDSAGIWSANGKGCGDEVECLPTHPVRGVCPEGWHLPTTDEWDPLLDALNGYVVAGRALKSRSGWYDNGDGTDVAGFSALPAGTIQQNGWSVGYHNAGDETGFAGCCIDKTNLLKRTETKVGETRQNAGFEQSAVIEVHRDATLRCSIAIVCDNKGKQRNRTNGEPHQPECHWTDVIHSHFLKDK